ncbi:MAG: NAD(P)-dependent oxidoreductase [Thermodesulfovibrionales bacterium]
MKALITGATGFIGSHLAERLLKMGMEVVCLVRDPSNLKNIKGKDVKTIKGDCSDIDTLRGIPPDLDYVFHLAGLTKSASPEGYYLANTTGTKNIVDVTLKNQKSLKRFVHLSSLAAVGPAKDDRAINESDVACPISEYGRSKLLAEEYVYNARFHLPITIIRPPVVYGPRDRDLFVFFKMINSGLAPYWKDCLYSTIYIDDLINGIIQSTMSEKAIGNVFFLADEKNYSQIEIIDAIAESLNKKPIKINLPYFALSLVGFFADRIKSSSIINPDKIREMKQKRWICSSKKATETFGFSSKVGIREGTQWTATWYITQNWLQTKR